MNRRILALYLPTPPKTNALPELAAALISVSPKVGIRPPDTIYLDVASTRRFFGGEKQILKFLKNILRTRGVEARLAIADDIATAGILARRGREFPQLVPLGENEKALSPLPIETLFFLVNPLSSPTEEETNAAKQAITVLNLLGVKTLGEFARIPASTIGPRFGKMGVELHHRARGESVLPLHLFQPTITYRESFSFETPILNREPLLFAAKSLLAKLEERFQKDLKAALAMNVFLETEYGEETEISIPLLRPLKKEKALLHVLQEKFSNLMLSAPLLSVAIELALPVPERGGQFHLFDMHEEQSEKLDELLGRLVAGLGPTLISAAELRERYRPERSWEPTPFHPFERSRVATPTLSPLPHAERPTVLLPQPEPLSAERNGGRLVLRSPKERFEITSLHGPERMSGDWWDGGAHARDYFRAEAANGQFLWIFKPLRPSPVAFFLHGYFD